MMKLRKDSYLVINSLRYGLCILTGMVGTIFTVMGILQAPHAGNLWLALAIPVALLLVGLILLGDSLRKHRRGERSGGDVSIL